MGERNCLRCEYRHKDNGNCTATGGFCTAVPAAHCPLLQKYLDTGMAPENVTSTYATDVVSVTRCKDCEKSGVTEFGKRYCKEPMGCFCGCIPVEDDYFCSGGRRKDGAE